jgi:hypothetical protein
VGAALDGVERKLLKKYNEDMEKIGADWEANREELTKALEEATAAEAAEEPDPLATLKAKAERAKLDCGLLTGDQLTFTETRKAMPPDALTAFKAAMAVRARAFAPEAPALALAPAERVLKQPRWPPLLTTPSRTRCSRPTPRARRSRR